MQLYLFESFIIIYLFTFIQPKKEVIRRNPNNISHPIPGKPTSEFNFQTESVDQKSNYDVHHVTSTVIQPKEENMALYSGLDWDINLEYNPLHPTDYDKITRGWS